MRVRWKGTWQKGEIEIETEQVDDLISAIDSLSSKAEVEQFVDIQSTGDVEAPDIAASKCSHAVREVLKSPWGKMKPRTMSEINKVLEQNALYFPKGTISSLLTLWTKKRTLRRTKQDGNWGYIYISD